jgi:hypothetical protein
MAGRPEVLRSAAYAVLSASGKQVVKVIEEEVRRGAVAITLDELMDRADLCRSSVRRGVRQCEVLGFVSVTMGFRRVGQFQLSDGGRAIDANEAERLAKQARLPTPPRASNVPPKPVRQVKAPVERPRTVGRVPSLPTMPWHDDRR